MSDLRQRNVAGAGGPETLPPVGGHKASLTSTPNQGKLICMFVGGPIALLLVIYPILMYIYHDPIAPYPCSGVCKVTDAMIAAAPAGCKPIDPKKIVFTHIHKTGGTNIRALMEARKYEKEWELTFMREWRDAVPHGVVHLPPKQLAAVTRQQYEITYKLRFMNGWLYRDRPHGVMYFGHVFFNDFSVPWEEADHTKHAGLPPNEVAYITMLREPIARMASQYQFDTFRAKHALYQEEQRRRQAGRNFGECAKDEDCRGAVDMERWCNTQTRYLCGWGAECQTVGNKPTQAMLDTAIQNFDAHIHFAGIQDDWLTSVRLFEKLMPTYFEGLEEEYKTGNKKNCEPWSWESLLQKKCPYQRNANTQKRNDGLDAEAMEVLKSVCWADIELYEHAKKRFEYQAATCLA